MELGTHRLLPDGPGGLAAAGAAGQAGMLAGGFPPPSTGTSRGAGSTPRSCVSNSPVGAHAWPEGPRGHSFTPAGVHHPAALASSMGHCAPGSPVKGWWPHILGAMSIALTPIYLEALVQGVVLP